MRQARLAEFLAQGEARGEDCLNGLEERFNELVARLRATGGHAHLAFVNRSLDGAVYAPLPDSFEEFRREVERELECGYRLVGVSVSTPSRGVEWLDSKLRPIPRKPKELVEVERNLKRRAPDSSQS